MYNFECGGLLCRTVCTRRTIMNQRPPFLFVSVVGMQSLELPLADDLHVHLRQDALMETVTSRIREGGIGRVLVMVS